MAGTVTVLEEVHSSLKKVAFAWLSSAGGAADGGTSLPYTGVLERLVTIPDGTDVPTAAYDVTVVDEDGADVLMGAGANRSASAIEQVLASSLGVVANDVLTLHVTNAGAATRGTVILYLR